MDETLITGHYAPGDIIIDSDSQVVYEYCTNTNSDGQCVSRIKVIPYESQIKQNQNDIETYSSTAVFILVIMLLVRLVKGIFRLILPTRWKRG